MISIDELVKMNLEIAEVKSTNNENIIIVCCGKEFILKKKLKVSKGEKIVVSIQDNKMIPLTIKNSPIIPEKDIEVGTKIQ